MPERHDNLASLFVERARESGPERGILYRTDQGWDAITYNEWAARAAAIARGLYGLGVRPGDRVLLVARTSVESLLVSWGITFVGAVLVPASHSLSSDDFRDLLALVKPKALFLGDPGLLSRLRSELAGYKGALGVLQTQCVLSEAGAGARPFLRLEEVVESREEVVSLEQLESHGGPSSRAVDLEKLMMSRRPEDPAVIIQTAGTIGEQKGVVLSNANLLFQARTLSFLLPVGPTDVQLLFLPLSHVLGFIAVVTSIAAATPLALGGGMRTLLEDLRDVRPTFMVGVPRVYEKIVEKLKAGMADFSAVWWEVYRRGLAAGRKVMDAQAEGRRPDPLSWFQLEAARRTVFQRCRELFGGRMRFLVSGGAPLAPDVAYTILSYGIALLNGFGLTESSGASHLQRFDHVRVGTVGPGLPMVQTRIAEDGEVLLKSPGLMLGYLDDADATARAIDGDGWLRTGDLGEIDPDGCLRITGRRKNVIVTGTGKNVVPARVESALLTIPLVANCLVVGDDRPYLGALVTVSAGRVAEWADSQGILFDNIDRLRNDMRLYKEIESQLEEVNKRLSPHERVRRFAILDREFSVDSGELTHDFKLRRRVVFERYRDVIEMLYRERY
jgi:long-chain acyl-CoA synthetase